MDKGKVRTRKDGVPRHSVTPGGPITMDRVGESMRTLTIWRDMVENVPIAETAKKLNIHVNTVTNIRNRIRAGNCGKEDIEERFRRPMLALYDDFVDSVQRGLKRGDASIVNGYGKGLGIWTDQSDLNLGLPSLSKDELANKAKRLIERITKRPG